MARKKKPREPLPPIWPAPDEFWAMVEPIIAELDPPHRVGSKRMVARPILDAIIYRGRTGCQWNRLPGEFPDDSTVHRAFQRWKDAGVCERLWAVLIERCEDLDRVDWEWQAAGGAMGKARTRGPCGAESDRLPLPHPVAPLIAISLTRSRCALT